MIEVKDNIEVKSESRHEFRPLKYPTLGDIAKIAKRAGIDLKIVAMIFFIIVATKHGFTDSFEGYFDSILAALEGKND